MSNKKRERKELLFLFKVLFIHYNKIKNQFIINVQWTTFSELSIKMYNVHVSRQKHRTDILVNSASKCTMYTFLDKNIAQIFYT